MQFDPPAHPVRYQASVEHLEKDEAETTASLVEALTKIEDITFADSGDGLRAVHAKSHGLLKGELLISEGLPEVLAQGLFAKPGRYPVVMRFSTTPGDILDDSVSTPRGLAIKVINVEGERLPGAEGANTQDFVLVNGKTFNAPNAKAFLANLKLLAATTDKAEGLKKAVSAALQGAESLLEAIGGKSATLVALGGHPETHVLGESYFSQVPVLYGDYIAKLGVVPVSPDLEALTGKHVSLSGRPNGLRDEVVEFFHTHGGEWELRVQLCTNSETMPVENAAKAWSEDESPYLTVARIVVAPQDAWSAERHRTIDEGMAFSPWHGLAAHRPLGSIMRVRKSTYEASAGLRSQHSGCPIHEPRSFQAD